MTSSVGALSSARVARISRREKVGLPARSSALPTAVCIKGSCRN